MAGTDIVKFEKYTLAQADTGVLNEVLDANLAGQEMGAGDLDRVKIPSGGQTVFEVPTLEGTDAAKTIQGVIVHHSLQRVYWKDSLDETGGGQPPDCQSPDNTWGYGQPGDELRAKGRGCGDCPYSNFGSADDGEGRGQACKQVHLLFVVTKDELLPFVISLPPTSLKPAKSYLWKLSSRLVPFYGVVTEIGLVKDSNQDGTEYAKATFSAVHRLTDEERARIKEYADKLAPVFSATRAFDENAASGDGDPIPPSGPSEGADGPESGPDVPA